MGEKQEDVGVRVAWVRGAEVDWYWRRAAAEKLDLTLSGILG